MSLPLDAPPLDPSSPVATQWVRDELAHGHYLTNPPWWQRLVEWLRGLLDSAPQAGLPRWVGVAVLLLVAALAAAVVARVLRPEGRTSRRTGERSAAVDDEGLSAADYRRRAQRAAARGDWDDLLLDSYRAIAASAVERTLLVGLPGRTAREVAVALTPVFPAQGSQLAEAARHFDEVRYGHRAPTSEQAQAVQGLDADLARTRPLHEVVVAQ
jgi:Domain of unknown function (DUF4129)